MKEEARKGCRKILESCFAGQRDGREQLSKNKTSVPRIVASRWTRGSSSSSIIPIGPSSSPGVVSSSLPSSPQGRLHPPLPSRTSPIDNELFYPSSFVSPPFHSPPFFLSFLPSFLLSFVPSLRSAPQSFSKMANLYFLYDHSLAISCN